MCLSCRHSLPEDAGKYFDKESRVLEAPMTIWVADQVCAGPFLGGPLAPREGSTALGPGPVPSEAPTVAPSCSAHLPCCGLVSSSASCHGAPAQQGRGKWSGHSPTLCTTDETSGLHHAGHRHHL